MTEHVEPAAEAVDPQMSREEAESLIDLLAVSNWIVPMARVIEDVPDAVQKATYLTLMLAKHFPEEADRLLAGIEDSFVAVSDENKMKFERRTVLKFVKKFVDAWREHRADPWEQAAKAKRSRDYANSLVNTVRDLQSAIDNGDVVVNGPDDLIAALKARGLDAEVEHQHLIQSNRAPQPRDSKGLVN